MQYRRARTKGGTYFFTVVTYKRRAILCIPSNIALLKETFRRVMDRHPFRIEAMVVLPDHLHSIWTLPEAEVSLFF
jgi:putative transposase